MLRAAFLVCFALLIRVPVSAADPTVGWGVDALLSCHVPEADVPAYISLLKQSGVRVVRERDTGMHDIDPTRRDYRISYELLRRAGFAVVAFAQENRDLGRTSWGPFPVDLRVVYNEGRRLGRDFAGLVNAWELHNEPDLAWWPDMPDRYGAHAKALYLGLKAGAKESGVDTPVILGALGLPPGPWLERMIKNDLPAYADAWNTHYYGEATQFGGFLESNFIAMRELRGEHHHSSRTMTAPRWRVKADGGSAGAIRPAAALPMWLTEVGLKTVTATSWSDADRRKKQADFMVSTARQAWMHPAVAVFMPFVLAHTNDPYAITESATRTWPAWDEYARFTQESPWPSRPLYTVNTNANRLVLQWLADGDTTDGHKVAGAYRWRVGGDAIRGELRAYNFGEKDVTGTLYGITESEAGWDEGGASAWRPFDVRKLRTGRGVQSFRSLKVPAGGMVSIPLVFSSDRVPPPGTREWRQFCFKDENGRLSYLGFALEQSPRDQILESMPLTPTSWAAEPRWSLVPNRSPAEGRGLWSAINGVRVLTNRQDGLARFELTGDPLDPEYPPMAAIRLARGLSGYTHLRVSSRRLLPQAVSVRVDLVDKAGRRFTIWENLGRARAQSVEDPTWMALADFHPFAWGMLDERRRLRLDEIREVQLRFYAQKSPAMIDIEIKLAKGITP